MAVPEFSLLGKNGYKWPNAVFSRETKSSRALSDQATLPFIAREKGACEKHQELNISNEKYTGIV